MSNAITEKKHILVVSSSPLALAEIKKGLMDTFEISIAATSPAALAALEQYETAAIIINIGEPRENAFSVNADITEIEEYKNIPVLFLADKYSEDDETEAFSADAADYTIRRPNNAKALISRINLRIRANENEKRIKPDEFAPHSPPADPETILAGKTILVVDDIELNRDFIAGILGDINGLTLDFAADGQEAVSKYTGAPCRYALILMDVQMPVMSGTEAAKTIRSLNCANSREIPIIALTAGVEEKETASYLEAGMNNFLEKPLVYDKLLNMVSMYVK